MSQEGPRTQSSLKAAGENSSRNAIGGSFSRGDALNGILIRALTSWTFLGLKVPLSNGTLAQDNMRQFLKRYKDHREKMEVARADGGPRRPCEVNLLIFPSIDF